MVLVVVVVVVMVVLVLVLVLVLVVVLVVVETMMVMLLQGAAVHGHLWQPRDRPGGGAAVAAAAAATHACLVINVTLQVDVEIDDGRSVLNRHTPQPFFFFCSEPIVSNERARQHLQAAQGCRPTPRVLRDDRWYRHHTSPSRDLSSHIPRTA